MNQNVWEGDTIGACLNLGKTNVAGTGCEHYNWKTNQGRKEGYSYSESVIENFDIYEVLNDIGRINTTLGTVLY